MSHQIFLESRRLESQSYWNRHVSRTLRPPIIHPRHGFVSSSSSASGAPGAVQTMTATTLAWSTGFMGRIHQRARKVTSCISNIGQTTASSNR